MYVAILALLKGPQYYNQEINRPPAKDEGKEIF